MRGSTALVGGGEGCSSSLELLFQTCILIVLRVAF